jgi:hypothetical protein
LYAASLLAPASAAPSRHVFVAEQLPWFEVLTNCRDTQQQAVVVQHLSA